ncbi:uncharacterized protein LOC130805307 isoform X5 [Amaranthus tricolor]|uniref:uncharacterized protein LOC130805307 isoform X5 n=1 Tax=Amaranthus tricolor TaxID=29722 RepID=UPI0025838BE2|nr:uncharacterized protein LOC130805307 isoform X5 [Amaranthus tricolor]
MHQGLKKIEINSLVPNLDRYILDYPGDHYLDRDQFVDEEEESDTPGYLEGPPRRVATLANLNFYKPLAEKALTYYNSKECTNLLLKEVLVADRQHQPETVVWMNFIARSEDDSKLFYFFANLQDGPYPNYHDVKEMCFEEDFKEPQPSDFQVKELCSLETHDSDYSQSIASRAWGYKVVYPQAWIILEIITLIVIKYRQHQPETVVCMNFIARSEDDSKLFYFFAKLQDGPYPNYHDVKEMCFEEDFKEPQPSDFQVKELCSLETHDSEIVL